MNSEAKASMDSNVLSFQGNPSSPYDRTTLTFSDQGAWFGFGFLKTNKDSVSTETGFSGPYLLTQENGIWSSESLIRISLGENIDLSDAITKQSAFSSHLNQIITTPDVRIAQNLVFSSGHSILINTTVVNTSDKAMTISPQVTGDLLAEGIYLSDDGEYMKIESAKSKAIGYLSFFEENRNVLIADSISYFMSCSDKIINTGDTLNLTIGLTFIFPEYNTKAELDQVKKDLKNVAEILEERIGEKTQETEMLQAKINIRWSDPIYNMLLQKATLTLQNNWRIPAGALKYAGLFPSYHYQWFNGFWAWDSWKHAAALAHYKPDLAKDQIRAMYDFQTENGFIPDCVYRDTSIEQHNYRNTKAPLSGWAVWQVYLQDQQLEFLKELYPKIKLQHDWWYENRDHDKDRLCEYGSTDGTLIAAKWESGMDNAVRFDSSAILQNSKNAYSLNQESVDLNAYLYAEKLFLAKMATELGNKQEAKQLEQDAEMLKSKIQEIFFDEASGYFYDVSISGDQLIKIKGCEGWIPLWAGCATKKQAFAVKENMMDERQFNTKVPLPTLAANHPKFKPEGGYWRGPNWLDQCYFGVKGLHNYGFDEEAYGLTKKLFQNSEGLLEKGPAIRENYNPITGEGLESYNFSWSAAHYLLLLLE